MQDRRAQLGAAVVLCLVGGGWASGESENHYETVKGVSNYIRSLASPQRGMEKISEGFVTDISLRGPTQGGTPADFRCNESEVIDLINAYNRGEHLSTDEMVYVLRAYELDYRKQMADPKCEKGYLKRTYYTGPAGPQTETVDAQ